MPSALHIPTALAPREGVFFRTIQLKHPPPTPASPLSVPGKTPPTLAPTNRPQIRRSARFVYPWRDLPSHGLMVADGAPALANLCQGAQPCSVPRVVDFPSVPLSPHSSRHSPSPARPRPNPASARAASPRARASPTPLPPNASRSAAFSLTAKRVRRSAIRSVRAAAPVCATWSPPPGAPQPPGSISAVPASPARAQTRPPPASAATR